MAFHRTYLGHGVGLRTNHFPEVTAGAARGRVDFFEVISENFLVPGGRPLAVLEQVRRDFPVLLHGVSLSIGASDRLNVPYLKQLRELADRFSPAWVSDHLCWGSAGGNYAHDLLPLPFSEEALVQVVTRVSQVQDLLGRQILLENVSSYLTFRGSQLSEWEFLAAVAEQADCGILLDVNNIYVSARNHGFSARAYLEGIPVDRVGQIHLAGHQDRGSYLFDSHDGPVIDPVWSLYRDAVARFGEVSTLIEWDEQIPSFDRLARESERSRRHMDRARRQKRGPKRAA
jgi:uncharacterized protein (UPF0276 family)